MSREIEKFHNNPDYYPGFERWVDPPPGRQCIRCDADMFIGSNGVTFFCSECQYAEQKGQREKETALLKRAKDNQFLMGWKKGFEEGFDSGVNYEKERRKRTENV